MSLSKLLNIYKSIKLIIATLLGCYKKLVTYIKNLAQSLACRSLLIGNNYYYRLETSTEPKAIAFLCVHHICCKLKPSRETRASSRTSGPLGRASAGV